MSQADTVLSELRIAGRRGVHSFQLRALYIANPSQRILELEGRGHLITHQREKLNGAASGVRYRLVSDVEGTAGVQASPPSPAAGGALDATPLPDLPPLLYRLAVRPRNAIFDEDAT